MSNENDLISPIAIDLGAKNTGVYFAHYKKGKTLGEIEKAGRVYQLEKDYTLLMQRRTASRHQRRGFDRRQMVKRLFKLIWEKHFDLEWDADIQQTISFLLNRRGFNYLTEEYDADILREFPQVVFEVLPEVVKTELADFANENGSYNLASALTQWSKQDSQIATIFKEIDKEPSRINKRQVVIKRAKKLREYCATRIQGGVVVEADNAKIKLDKLSKWIVDEWIAKKLQVEGIENATYEENGTEKNVIEDKVVHLIQYLNRQAPETAQTILGSIPDYSTEEAEIKSSVWDFNSTELKNIEEKKEGNFFYSSDKSNDSKPNIKNHLHHLAFALHKIHNELESGGRHRSKYFDEINEALNNKSHTHGYLKRFCQRLHDDEFKLSDENSLDVEKLTNLIGHLSNLELKPLRKYFNDKEYSVKKGGDQWDEKRLAAIFSRWVLSEWRVNPEKDKDKAEGKQGDYKQLREDWIADKNNTPDSVVDFWLKTKPFLTIPPYQDNNNRRPPRCQSLVLNAEYLDKKYPDWEKWFEILNDLQSDYLGDFETELKELKSGKGKPYFSDDCQPKSKRGKGNSQCRSQQDLQARVLQFIFDRVKASDPLHLNEIFSHTKKIRQLNAKEEKGTDEYNNIVKKLETAINESKLPKDLKTQPDDNNDAVFADKTFPHLVCDYYKQRQRARDGRIYIHPQYRYVKDRDSYENTGRFDDKDCLLTYCNHKPRQKKYQLLFDVAGALHVSPKKLQEVLDEKPGDTLIEKLDHWLNSFDALKANCVRAAKEQKVCGSRCFVMG